MVVLNSFDSICVYINFPRPVKRVLHGICFHLPMGVMFSSENIRGLFTRQVVIARQEAGSF